MTSSPSSSDPGTGGHHSEPAIPWTSVDFELDRYLQGAEPEHWVATSSSPLPAPDDGERRRALRFDLAGRAFIRAWIVGAPGTPPSRGRLTDLSLTGGVMIETRAPLPFRTDVRVELTLSDGRSTAFAGRVVRRPEVGMAIQIKTDPVSREFIRAFAEEALKPGSRAPSATVTRVVGEGVVTSDETPLEQAWSVLTTALDDEEAHERFVELCLKERRLDFALDKYRALRGLYPADESITRRIERIGTILAFAGLHRKEAQAAPSSLKVPAPVKLLLLLLVSLAALFIVLRLKG